MNHLEECHGILTELVEVVLVVSQRQGKGLQEVVRTLNVLFKPEHASILEGLSKFLWPQVGTEAELFILDMGVISWKFAADVVAFLEIGLGASLNHLGRHGLVSAVVLVLRLVQLHLCLDGESKELLRLLHHLLLQGDGDRMVDDLEEAFLHASFADFLCAFLHTSFISGQEVAEINDRRTFGRHFEGQVMFSLE